MLLVRWMSSSLSQNGKYTLTDGRLSFQVCPSTWYTIVGVGRNKFYNCARAAAAHDGRAAKILHGRVGLVNKERAKGLPTQADICKIFYPWWSSIFCQMSGGGDLLWPQGLTVVQLWGSTFQDWLAKTYPAQPDFYTPHPSCQTFRDAIASKEFKHIKMRHENNHARCSK